MRKTEARFVKNTDGVRVFTEDEYRSEILKISVHGKLKDVQITVTYEEEEEDAEG